MRLIPLLVLSSLMAAIAAGAAQACLTGADMDCDDEVNITELHGHINEWYKCSACVTDMFQALQAYYRIPFCGDHVCNSTVGEDCSRCGQDCGCFSGYLCLDGECVDSAQDLPRDYVAYWRFEGNANDETGVNNGTLMDDASITFDSRRGNVLGLDGLRDYVNMGTGIPNIGTNDFTLSAWMKTGNRLGREAVIAKGSTGYGEVMLQKSDDFDKIICYGRDVSGSPEFLLSATTGWISNPFFLPDWSWNFIACTKDTSSATLYINGVAVATDTSIGGINLTNTRNWNIGAARDGSERGFRGSIDDVMVYNRSLSEAEILQIYNTQNECQTDGQCDDDNNCTIDICDPSNSSADLMGCVFENVESGVVCDDGLFCTVNTFCDGLGNCEGDIVDCDDGKTCTTDVCREGNRSYYDGSYDFYVCENWGDNNNCNSGEICEPLDSGANLTTGCAANPCSGINDCSYYNSSGETACNDDDCVFGGCEWNSGLGVCEVAPSLGYEGFGTVTRGALDCPTGYQVYNVTHLGDSGTGSFRDAVSQGCRYVVFGVGGTIALTNNFYFDKGFLTIDGSTAPSPGITVFGVVGFKAVNGGHDIIIHNIRGDGNFTPPAIGGADMWAMDPIHGNIFSGPEIYNIIVDHCTFTSAADGVFDTRGEIENVTYSFNLFKDTEAMGSFSDQGYRKGISFHHNVLAHGGKRMPQIRNQGSNTTNFDLVNNVIYGWGTWKHYTGVDEGLRIYDYESMLYELHVTNNWYEPLGGSPTTAIIGLPNYNSTRIDFEGNVFPPEEKDDDVDTAVLPPDIPAWAQVTTYTASDLGNAVVPCAGTHYKTPEEQALLDEISLAIGGQGYYPRNCIV